MVLAVAWEVLLVLGSLAVARRWSSIVAEQWLGALAVALTVDGLLGTWLTWAGWNHPLVYLAPAALLIVPAWRSWREISGWGDWRFWPIPLVLLFIALRPVTDADSLYNLHFVLGWLENRTTPLEYAFNYPGFWEAGLLPLLTLARTDTVLWLRPAEALAVVALGGWLIGEELGVERRLRGAAVVCSMAFLHFWWGQSGVATAKNDLMAAAGQVIAGLVVLRVARGKAGRWEAALAGLAAVFVSTKFSGPFLVGAGIVAWLACRRKVDWGWATGLGLLWMATVGFSYAANWWRFGNPLYPFTLKIGPLLLPGRADQSATAIWANIGNTRVWRLFFLPDGGVSPAGVLFPLLLILAPVALWRVSKGLWVFCGLLAALYVRSIYGAGGGPGDLHLLEADLSTLRFVEGGLVVAEMAAIAALGQWGWLFVIVQGLSRLLLITRRESVEAVMGALAIATGVCLAAWLLKRWPVFVLGAAMVAGCWMVERRRSTWLPEMAGVWQVLYDEPATRVSLLIDDEYSPQLCAHWWVKGKGLRHEVVIGENQASRFVVWPRWPSGSAPHWSGQGYRVRAEAREAVLWEHEPTTNSRTEDRR